jgi:putative ABC transport system permease protein
MMDSPSRRAPGERAYGLLLLLYPPSFRRRYGRAMLEFYRDRVREERRAGRPVAPLWMRAVGDALLTIPGEHLAALLSHLRALGDPPPPRASEDPVFRTLPQDLRYALRGLARTPAVTAVILGTLALGIGANTAIFSVVRGVLIRPLPYRDVERIVEISHEAPYGSVSEPEFMDYRRDAVGLDRLAAFTGGEATLTGTDEPERIRFARVSDGFFDILGTPALLGRTLLDEDDRRGGPRVVVISEGLWRRRFGGDPAVVGSDIALSGTSVTVVGVMPTEFAYPSAGTSVWSPLRLDPDSLWTRNNHYLRLIGRLSSGSTRASVVAGLHTLTRRWLTDFSETYFPGKPLTATVTPLRDTIVGSTRPYLLALLGAVGLVLLIACVNVANLLLARGEARRKELAIRTALGASRRRIAAQLLTESALLALLGGAAGLLLGWWGVRALVALAPSSIPRLDAVGIDGGVLLFTLATAVATGALFGIVPALRAARSGTADTLRDGGKSSRTHSSRAMRRGLVIAEVALSVVMLAGAGLLVRSLISLQRIDLGFRPENVMTMSVSLPRDYAGGRNVLLFDRLLQEIRALPNVQSAAAASWLPLADVRGNSWSIMLDGVVVENISESPSATPQAVTPEYFRTIGMSIVRGRGFTDSDRADAPYVAVVNETMARQMWAGADPIGHTLKMFGDEAPWVTVVGVARDVRTWGYLMDTPPTMYFPYAQAESTAYFAPVAMSVVVKVSRDPASLVPAVRAMLRKMEPGAPVFDARTLEDVTESAIGDRRFATALLTSLAALAVTLAAIGIYGVISYGVTRRRYEIGIRMALGAERGSVLRLVLGEGVGLTAVGVAIGLVAAVGSSRLLRSLLVGVSSVDPVTLITVAGALVGVALLASLFPAKRAMAVSPTEALRAE